MIFTEQSSIKYITDAMQNAGQNIENSLSFFDKIKETVKEYLASFGVNLIIGLILLIAGWKLINVITKSLKKWKPYQKIEPTMQSFIKSLVGISLKVILIITVASILGVPMTSMITVIGSCGLAIGLALQGSLSNIAGGFILAITKPFKVGDFIISGSHQGYVKSINIFTTKLITIDNSIIIIPNSEISNAAITDLNAFETRRVDIPVSVDYSADTNTVKNLLLRTALRNELIIDEPKPVAVLKNYGDNSLDFELRVWCKTENYWDVKFSMLEQVKAVLDENNISIPYPQLDIHVDRKE